jgi:hypothetical protein
MASWQADAFHAEVLTDARRLLFGEHAIKGAMRSIKVTAGGCGV